MKKNITKTPFDLILRKIHHEIWKKHSKDIRLSYIGGQLRILKILYISMARYNQYKIFNKPKLKNETSLIKVSDELQLQAIASYLSYYFFIDILKIFADGLDLKNILIKDKFPKYYQIKIFRDKIIQHWDEYVYQQNLGCLMQFKSRLSLPVIYDGTKNKIEFNNNINKIINIFKSNNISISKNLFTKEPQIATHLKSHHYHERIFDSLVSIYKNTNKLPPNLIKSLFIVGFPLPILNVNIYIDLLVKKIETSLINKKILSKNIKRYNKIYHYIFFTKTKNQ